MCAHSGHFCKEREFAFSVHCVFRSFSVVSCTFDPDIAQYLHWATKRERDERRFELWQNVEDRFDAIANGSFRDLLP